MKAIENGGSTQGGEQVNTQVMRVQISPSVNRKDADWVCRALAAIQTDNASLMGRLLSEKKRPIFGKPCTFKFDGKPEAGEMTLLQLALRAKSFGCLEVLSQRWHEAGLYSEVEEADMPVLMSFESDPNLRASQILVQIIAALARGLFKAQARSEDYGLGQFAYGYPLASQTVARTFAEQTPVPGPTSKLFQKRAYWLRHAARCVADSDALGLDACLDELDALPATVEKGLEFMECHLLLMSCLSMNRLSFSSPIFNRLGRFNDVAELIDWEQYFLVQLTANLTYAGVGLSAGEENELAAGIASVVLNFSSEPVPRMTLVSSLTSKDFHSQLGPISAVAEKAATQILCEMEWQALQSSIQPAAAAAAPSHRTSLSL